MRINNFREVNSRSIGGDDVFLKMSCCGCSACLQKCPKKCIEMHEDAEGFLYPEINDDFCIDCGICYNVCPVKNQKPNCKPLAFYASQSKDETLRLQSSSGGIFSLLAEYTIRKGGIVFGARFNEKMELVHEYTETINGLAARKQASGITQSSALTVIVCCGIGNHFFFAVFCSRQPQYIS